MPDDVVIDPDLSVDGGEAAPEPEPFTLPENFADTVQSWGVPIDAIPEAVEAYKRSQTEEGVIDGFIAYGQSLGFGIKELNRLFEDDVPPAPVAPAPAAAVEPPDPDALLTRAEVDAMIADVRKEQETFAQSQQEREFKAKQAQVFGAIDNWFQTNNVEDEQARKMIASFGEKHILPTQDSYDPRVSLAALERGKAEYDAWREAEAQRYLKAKGASALGQPTPVGGGQTHGGGSDEAPVDYAELRGGALATAKERVRNRLRDSGELG